MGDKYWMWVRVQDDKCVYNTPPTTSLFVGEGFDMTKSSEGGIWVWVGVYATTNPTATRSTRTGGVVKWLRMGGLFWNIFTNPKKFKEANW